MELREQKALHIAATTALAPDRGRWKVPSQTGNGNYAVMVLTDGSWSCTCPDYEERLDRCKHIMAVEVTMRREGGVAPTEFSEVVKVTYSQDWKAYNAAQTNEKRLFIALLADLCSTIPQPEYTRGRPRLPLSDMMLAHIYRCYVGCSARRFQSDLADARERGLIDQVPAYNSVLVYSKAAEHTALLADLVTTSALPLAAVETQFAIDSTGFGAPGKESWYSKKHGRVIQVRQYAKLHAVAGTATHVVTAADVTDSDVNDSPRLPELARRTAKHFNLHELSADKGYSSKANADAIEQLGATPFIAFKDNARGHGPGTAWGRMYHYFAYNRDDFLDHYHRRSNVETTFAMIKAKFGDRLLAKTPTAQANEILGRVICHNLVVLVQAIYELGIEPNLKLRTA